MGTRYLADQYAEKATALEKGSLAGGSPNGAAIMSSITDIQPAVADGRSDMYSLIGPATLAIGGSLSLVWACALGLCTYDLVCWLFA